MGHHPSPQATQTYINESSTTLARTTLARGSWPTHRPIEWVQPFGYCITAVVGGIHKFIKSFTTWLTIENINSLTSDIPKPM